MCQLIKLGSDLFAVTHDGIFAVGSLHDARSYLIECRGIQEVAIEEGLKMMEELDHNMVDFGINGTWTYSARKAVEIPMPAPMAAA